MRHDGGMVADVGSPARPAETRGVAAWSSAEWRNAAVRWVDARLTELGERRTGDPEQRSLRPWATVLRVPTSSGPMWLKAAAEATAAEVALYGLLTRVAPEQVLHPVAADEGLGWLLLPDGGTSLWEALERIDAVQVLEQVLPEYGDLQLALAPSVPELLRIGLHDMRPDRMPARFDEAAAAVRRRVARDRLVDYERVVAHRPVFDAWTRELADSPVPVSVDHNDLHAANILIPPAVGSVPARFYDWGDAVVAHPFATMLPALGWLPSFLGVREDDPRMRRVRDAYLGSFSAFGSRPELVRTL
jgi:hypothetical protein